MTSEYAIRFEDGWWNVYDGAVCVDGFDTEKDAVLFVRWYEEQYA